MGWECSCVRACVLYLRMLTARSWHADPVLAGRDGGVAGSLSLT
jgi:hypothetical protein